MSFNTNGRVYVIPIHWIPSLCSFRKNWVIILMCASSGGLTFFYQLQLNCKFEPHTDNCLTEKTILNSNHWNKIYSVSYRVTPALLLNFLILLVLPVCVSSTWNTNKIQPLLLSFLKNPSRHHFYCWSRSTGAAWSIISVTAETAIGDQLRREKFVSTSGTNFPFMELVG